MRLFFHSRWLNMAAIVWLVLWAVFTLWIGVEDGYCHAVGHSFWPIDGSC